MFEYAVLGIIQGLTEWLPISSEGIIFLTKLTFFSQDGFSFQDTFSLALFLHLGTFLAALIYFRRDVLRLTRSFFHFRQSPSADRRVIVFLVISTILSGGFGIGLLTFLSGGFSIGLLTLAVDTLLATSPKVITLIIGLLLLITGGLGLTVRSRGARPEESVSIADSVILGILQSLSALPGISRSGITVAGLLLRGLDDQAALRLSFLMSLPIVLGGNIILNLKNGLIFNFPALIGLALSFIFGLLTIHLLLRLARRISFAWFAIIFGMLSVISIFI